jgi:hypothetical protein
MANEPYIQRTVGTLDRVRTVLYEASLIFLTGVVVAVVGFSIWSRLYQPSLVRFSREYAAADAHEQIRISERYLDLYPAGELLQMVEAVHSAGVCHVEAHPFGRAVYRHTKNFSESIKQCGGACTYGCFHGAMMEMFATESDTLGGVVNEEDPDSYLDHVKALAPDLCDRPEVASVVRSRFCTHGIGHTFAYLSQGDLAEAVASCEVLDSKSSISSCVTGVFMEYLFDPSRIRELDTTGPEPCDIYPKYTGECYRYKAYGWLHAWGTVDAALSSCSALGEHRLQCIREVAEASSTEQLLKTQEGIESLCGSRTGDERRMCVIGAFLKIIDLNNGDDSDHACDRVLVGYRSICLQILHEYHAAHQTRQ